MGQELLSGQLARQLARVLHFWQTRAAVLWGQGRCPIYSLEWDNEFEVALKKLMQFPARAYFSIKKVRAMGSGIGPWLPVVKLHGSVWDQVSLPSTYLLWSVPWAILITSLPCSILCHRWSLHRFMDEFLNGRSIEKTNRAKLFKKNPNTEHQLLEFFLTGSEIN